MSAEVLSLSFKDLHSIPTEELSEKFPPETAVQMTLKSLQIDDIPKCDIYKSWATLLFQHYGPSKLEEKDLNELLNAFTGAIKEFIDVCATDECDEKLEDLFTFLNYTLELLTWIHSIAIEFSLYEVTAFLCFGLATVDNYLTMTLNKTNFKRFLDKSLAVQKMILNIFSRVGSTQTYSGKDLNKFMIEHLCSIGEKTPKLDIKTAVDTWKATVKLLSQNTALSEITKMADRTWLARPMKFLIQEIGRNIQTVYSENSLKEPIVQIEKYLKVTNFYLRLLQKVASDFQHTGFPVCEEYVDNLVIIYNPPQAILGSPVENLVAEYVAKSFKELIQYSYKDLRCFELLLDKQSDDFEKNECLHRILLDAIEIAIRKNDIQFVDGQIFGRIFENCLRNSYIFLSKPLYNRFLEIFAAVQTYFRPEQLERDLIQIVLQEDIALAIAAIDVWSIIFKNANKSDRSMCLMFWRGINENFSKFSNQQTSTHVEILMRNLYAMLSVEEKEEIWLNFDAGALTNDRFLLTIGLEGIPNNAKRKQIIQHFAEELQRFLKECARDMTVDNFYSIIKYIQLLTPTTFNSDDLNNVLLHYLEAILKQTKFDLFTETILNFLALRCESIKDNKLLQLLTDLSNELSRFHSYDMKLCLFKFLTRVANNSRLKEHARSMLTIIEKDELIKCFGYTQKTGQKPNNSLLCDIVKKRSLDVVVEAHVCQMQKDIPAKRMKKEIDDVLEQLEITVDKLRKVAELEPLDLPRIRILTQIVRKLETIDGSR